MKGENKLGEGGVVMTGESGSMYGGKGGAQVGEGRAAKGGGQRGGAFGVEGMKDKMLWENQPLVMTCP